MQAGTACPLAVAVLVAAAVATDHVIDSSTPSWTALLTGLKARGPGDNVYFKAGTYSTVSGSGPLNPVIQGSADARITIATYPGEPSRAVLRRPDAGQNILDLPSARYLTVENLEFTGGSRGLRLGPGNVSHVTLRNLLVHDTADNAFSCNDDKSDCSGIVVEGVEVYNTGKNTGECFYFGCSSGNCQTHDSVFRNNFCHDTMLATSGSRGSGFQIKTGSYRNLVQNNVCYRTGGPCVLVYDDWDRGQNVIEGNLVVTTRDNGAVIRNNIVINTTAAGIAVIPNSVQPGKSPRNVQILHNTVMNSSDYCLRGSSWTAAIGTFTVANNAFFCANTSKMDNQAGATWDSNAYPLATSRLVAPGGSTKYASGNDFNCETRSGSTVTIGAYQYTKSTEGNAGGWQIAEGFKTCLSPTSEDMPWLSSAGGTPAGRSELSHSAGARSSSGFHFAAASAAALVLLPRPC
eukprot:m51a1_g5213 hypothetical protein (462) ;mRNA; f:250635-252419